MVDKASATLNIPNEQIIPLNTNHSMVCKFPNEEYGAYLMVRNSVTQMAQALKEERPTENRPNSVLECGKTPAHGCGSESQRDNGGSLTNPGGVSQG